MNILRNQMRSTQKLDARQQNENNRWLREFNDKWFVWFWEGDRRTRRLNELQCAHSIPFVICLKHSHSRATTCLGNSIACFPACFWSFAKTISWKQQKWNFLSRPWCFAALKQILKSVLSFASQSSLITGLPAVWFQQKTFWASGGPCAEDSLDSMRIREQKFLSCGWIPDLLDDHNLEMRSTSKASKRFCHQRCEVLVQFQCSFHPRFFGFLSLKCLRFTAAANMSFCLQSNVLRRKLLFIGPVPSFGAQPPGGELLTFGDWFQTDRMPTRLAWWQRSS